jgi:amino acid adenylation domain-containing protein
LSYMTDLERRELLDGFNNTEVLYPLDKTVIDLFEDQVRRTPDKLAVHDEDCSLSYGELNALSSKIAEQLYPLNISNESSPVGVILERSVSMIAVLIAIMKSGKPYIPLDPNFPQDRLNYLIEHSGIDIIILENQELSRNFDVTHKLLKEDLLEKTCNSSGKFPSKATSSDSAYIIYTSGSTGKPKGVEISHRSLVNFIESINKKPGIKESDVLLSVTTFSFDISLLEFFATLVAGATLYLPAKETLLNPDEVIARINKFSITLLQATPSFYGMLFKENRSRNNNLRLLCGGEPVSESLLKKLLLVSKEVWNMYGPTETTIWSSVKKLTVPAEALNIGQPINNTRFYIFDDNGNPVPVGVLGNIYIAGDGLAKGYYRDPDATDNRFIVHPLFTSQRIYNTGDIGRWLPNGEIEFFGRKDRQVKIRGFRIELEEIEKAIVDYSSHIEQSIVLVKEHLGESVLVAYLLSSEMDIEKTSLLAYLKGKLPVYMIPNYYHFMDSFPLTPNGKLDKKNMPQVSEAFQIKNEFLPPKNRTEAELVRIWKEVLKVEEISTTDNFFDLGGTSLKLVEIHSKINSLWAGKLTMADMFVLNSINALAVALSDSTDHKDLMNSGEVNFFDI